MKMDLAKIVAELLNSINLTTLASGARFNLMKSSGHFICPQI